MQVDCNIDDDDNDVKNLCPDGKKAVSVAWVQGSGSIVAQTSDVCRRKDKVDVKIAPFRVESGKRVSGGESNDGSGDERE